MGKAAAARSLHYFDVIIIFQKNEEPDINKNACASGRSIYLSAARHRRVVQNNTRITLTAATAPSAAALVARREREGVVFSHTQQQHFCIERVSARAALARSHFTHG